MAAGENEKLSMVTAEVATGAAEDGAAPLAAAAWSWAMVATGGSAGAGAAAAAAGFVAAWVVPLQAVSPPAATTRPSAAARRARRENGRDIRVYLSARFGPAARFRLFRPRDTDGVTSPADSAGAFL